MMYWYFRLGKNAKKYNQDKDEEEDMFQKRFCLLKHLSVW